MGKGCECFLSPCNILVPVLAIWYVWLHLLFSATHCGMRWCSLFSDQTVGKLGILLRNYVLTSAIRIWILILQRIFFLLLCVIVYYMSQKRELAQHTRIIFQTDSPMALQNIWLCFQPFDLWFHMFAKYKIKVKFRNVLTLSKFNLLCLKK